jgi:hypothetical protein
MQVQIHVIGGGPTGQTFSLFIPPGQRISIGRANDNMVPFPSERSLSSHHAELINDGHQIVLHDRGSTNGTFINDRPIKNEPLMQGSIARFGRRGPVLQFHFQAPQPICAACGAGLGQNAFVCIECGRPQCGTHFDPAGGCCVSCASARDVASAVDGDPFAAFHRQPGQPGPPQQPGPGGAAAYPKPPVGPPPPPGLQGVRGAQPVVCPYCRRQVAPELMRGGACASCQRGG